MHNGWVKMTGDDEHRLFEASGAERRLSQSKNPD